MSAMPVHDGVVLLHGIFRTSRSMRGLAAFLSDKGFQVLNLDYPSTRFPIEALIDHIHPPIAGFAEECPGSLHFVGFSMGGLVVRAYIHKHRPARLGRVVLVGTPNSGSEVADALRHVWVYRWLYGPAGQQLVTDQTAFSHIFGNVDYEAGVIAGNRTVDFISSWIIGKPNDGKVSIDSTRLEGMTCHKVIPANHTFFPGDRQMWRCVAQFLQTGRMDQETAASA